MHINELELLFCKSYSQEQAIASLLGVLRQVRNPETVFPSYVSRFSNQWSPSPSVAITYSEILAILNSQFAY